jgi:hypothetical protein
MADAMHTVRTLRKAVAQVAIRRTVLLCIKGPLPPHGNALARWWQWLRNTPAGAELAWWRGGHSPSWRKLDVPENSPDLLTTLAPPHGPCIPLWLQFACGPDAADDSQRVSMLIQDLPPVMGIERASLILLRLPDDTPPATFMQLGEASLQLLPLWWGTAGYAFETMSGRPDVVARRMVALAHRHWCVQILDLTALQWDALNGLPGTTWLHWIGAAFAEHRGTTLEALAQAAAAELPHSVFHRLTPRGLSIAAGASPHTGDMNLADDLRPYARTAAVLKPLMLQALTPMAGRLADPKLLDAWLHRFDAPEGWLDAAAPDT